ncbi:MAG: class I SAM-dependent methyltransferase [Acidiferrobacterales bacterium]|nr:class I SAM-dependent methyltransferase [Acidiferrobacterales bacterium]
MTNISETAFSKWLNSKYAQQYLACETLHLKNALRQVSGPKVLLLGNLINIDVIKDIDFPLCVLASIEAAPEVDACLQLDPAFLPFQEESISTIIVPHVLERHKLHYQVLRESHRVLLSEGHIILTGFNPVSFIGLQRLIFKRAACPGNYFTVKRTTDWLQLLGFEVVASATFQYSPLFSKPRMQHFFSFLNPLGNRWLPMLGGGYMITARKKQGAGTLVGPLDFVKTPVKKRRRKLATANSQSKKRSIK